MKRWKCTVCGYIHKGDEPPAKCPVCGADRSRFISLDDEEKAATDQDQSKPPPLIEPADEPEAAEKKWKCTVCGYIHKGPAPPLKCPVCGADQKKFILVEEDVEVTPAEIVSEQDEAAQNHTDTPKSIHKKIAIKGQSLEQLAKKAQILTRLHGHPIAVHIPNGVLPLTIIFTILAFIFKSDHLAIAAKYNALFVSMTMPVVLLTGAIDWFNRFNGQITQVFTIKIVCGVIVTFLTLTIAIWWLAAPDIHLGASGASGLFLFLNLIDLAAAATAGFYGGKLVFHE